MRTDMNTKYTGRYKHTKRTEPKIEDITRYKEYTMYITPNVINENTKKQWTQYQKLAMRTYDI